MKHRIYVITGERGAGKSLYCAQLLDNFKKAGLSVGGFIAPAVYEDGRKMAFYTQDVRSGEKRLCGKRVSTGGTVGCWKMDDSVVQWGSRLLETACPCDRLFIDELGPLEFFQNGGYQAAFDVLKAGNYDKAYVVVRPACLDAFHERVGDFKIITIGTEHVSLD